MNKLREATTRRLTLKSLGECVVFSFEEFGTFDVLCYSDLVSFGTPRVSGLRRSLASPSAVASRASRLKIARSTPRHICKIRKAAYVASSVRL